MKRALTQKQIKKMLALNLEQKLVDAFNARKNAGDRLAQRRYTQLIDTIDDIKRQTKQGRGTR